MQLELCQCFQFWKQTQGPPFLDPAANSAIAHRRGKRGSTVVEKIFEIEFLTTSFVARKQGVPLFYPLKDLPYLTTCALENTIKSHYVASDDCRAERRVGFFVPKS